MMQRYALYDTYKHAYLKHVNGPPVQSWEDCFHFTRLSIALKWARSMNVIRLLDKISLVEIHEYNAKGDLIKVVTAQPNEMHDC